MEGKISRQKIIVESRDYSVGISCELESAIII